LIRALRERQRGKKPIAVCNELTTATRAALLDGVIDLALGTPIAALSKSLVEAMARASITAEFSKLPPMMLPPDIYLSENI
jgi:LacI family transcriptional regulator